MLSIKKHILVAGIVVGLGFAFVVTVILWLIDRSVTDSTTHLDAAHQLLEADFIETFSFEELTRYRTDFDRDLIMYNVLSRSTKQDMGELLRRFSMTQWYSRHLQLNIHALLVRRLSELDATSALAHITELPAGLSQLLVCEVFQEWSWLNLQQAIQSAAQLSEPLKTLALTTVIETRDDLSPEELLELGQSIGEMELIAALIKERQSSSTEQNPVLSWESAITDDVQDGLQRGRLVEISDLVLAQEGFDGLIELMKKHPPGVILEQLAQVTHSVIGRQVQGQYQAKFNEALSLEGGEGKYIRSAIVDAWGLAEPAQAYETLMNMPRSTEQQKLLKNLMLIWGESDPDSMLQQLDRIPSEFQLFAEDALFTGIAARNPVEA